MRIYLVRRLLLVVPTVLMISLVVFVMMRSVPGDPVVALLGDAYTEEDAAQMREAYGLERPVIVQYLVGTVVENIADTSVTVLIRGESDSCRLGASPGPLHQGQLPSDSSGASRVGALRAREGGVHRCAPA